MLPLSPEAFLCRKYENRVNTPHTSQNLKEKSIYLKIFGRDVWSPCFLLLTVERRGSVWVTNVVFTEASAAQ